MQVKDLNELVKPYHVSLMVEQVPYSNKLHEPIQILHFIEELSLKVHKLLDDRLILNTVADEFEKRTEYGVSVFLVNEDGLSLRLLKSSTPFKDLEKVKKLSRIRLEKEGVDLSRSRLFNQVVKEGKSLKVGAYELLSDLVSKPLSFFVSKMVGLTRKEMILAPIHRSGKVFAVLAISGNEFTESFIPSMANLSQHISYSLEHVDERISQTKVEEALLLELKKFQRYLNTMDVIMLVLDSNLVVLEINQKGCELLGSPASEVVGEGFVTKFVSLNKRKEVQAVLRNMVSKGTQSVGQYEDLLVSKDGQEHVILWCNTPLKDSNGKVVGILCSGVDISKRKEDENSLQESYRSLLDLVNHLQGVVYRRFNDREFKVEFISDGCCSLTGYNPADLTGSKRLSYSQIIYPEDLDLVRKKVQEGLKQFNQFQVEYRIITARGEIKWVMDRGKVVQIGSDGIAMVEGFITDITDKMSAVEDLKRSEERFRALSDNSSDIIFLYDVKKGFEYVNPTSSRIIGYSPEEFYSDKNLLFKIVHLEDSKRLTQTFEEATEYRRPVTKEVRWIHKNGGVVWTEYTVIPIYNKSGELIAIEGILRDIIERRNLEAERRRFEDRLSALSFYEGTLNTARNLQQLYELTLDAIVKSLGFEYAVFMVVDKGGLKPVCQRGHSKLLFSQLPLDGSKGGLIARVVATKKTMLVQNVWDIKDYIEIFPGIRSEICTPVIVEDEIVGVLDVESKKINAFDEKDAKLIEILASHMATAISNKEKQMEIERRSNQLTSLLRNSAKMLSITDLRNRLQVIAESIQELGWRRVVISLRDENLAIKSQDGMVCAGLTPEERDFLWRNQNPELWRERLSPEYKRFKIGQFYYLPWSDPWVRERFEATTIPSKLAPEDMVNWDPQDILYAPLTLADGKIVGIVSIDDPVDGKKPTRDSLAPLELFLTQAAVAIENAQLIRELNNATNQVKEYADLLEQKVDQRTKELIEAQNKLIKSERLAAIGEVAAMVGHDLRNPLQVIVYTLFLANEMFKRISPEVRKIMEQQGVIEMLERIGEQVTYMNKIVSDLQDYAKPLKPELLETSLSQIINTILATITVPEKIKVNIEVAEDFPKIPMDKAMIRRVLTNLITNAIQAMPDGGELTIKSSIEGDMAVISVKDTGVGIAKENIDKLFQPLYTTKSKGQGLGLAVSKRLIDAHEGSIEVESEVNKGSTFTIKLPFRKLKYSQND